MDKKVLFICRLISFSWDKRNECRFITDDGSIYEFNFNNHDLPKKTTVNDILSFCQNILKDNTIVPLATINKEEITKAYELVPRIKSFGYEMKQISNDDGEISLSVVQNGSIKIIATTGQFFGCAEGEEVQQILKILEKNNFFSTNYTFATISCFS
ncbi:hypothetical protein M9Y10_016075 [Tritrichomonas musculus]|uniref:Uncharacterized protein n=1 Tax=Tritrichomonas musculus TaxID=1915356 RepID=A0ABR2I5D9_9EUKA